MSRPGMTTGRGAHVLSPETLKDIYRRLDRLEVRRSSSVRVKQTSKGTILSVINQPSDLRWSFQCTWSSTPGDIDVAAGAVYCPEWAGETDPEDPLPNSTVAWVRKVSVAADTKTVNDGQSIYLQLDLDKYIFGSQGPHPHDDVETVHSGGDGPSEDGVNANFWDVDNAGLIVNSTATPPTSTPSLMHIPLCDRDGAAIIHRHVGDFYLYLPWLPYIHPTPWLGGPGTW
jgi:hypothetical protein